MVNVWSGQVCFPYRDVLGGFDTIVYSISKLYLREGLLYLISWILNSEYFGSWYLLKYIEECLSDSTGIWYSLRRGSTTGSPLFSVDLTGLSDFDYVNCASDYTPNICPNSPSQESDL